MSRQKVAFEAVNVMEGLQIEYGRSFKSAF